jgi:hypothetical protein
VGPDYQSPQASSSDPGKVFDDQIGTRGGKRIELSQTFTISLSNTPACRVSIEPCIGYQSPGPLVQQNIVRATNQQVLINDDPGGPDRVCR